MFVCTKSFVFKLLDIRAYRYTFIIVYDGHVLRICVRIIKPHEQFDRLFLGFLGINSFIRKSYEYVAIRGIQLDDTFRLLLLRNCRLDGYNLCSKFFFFYRKVSWPGNKIRSTKRVRTLSRIKSFLSAQFGPELARCLSVKTSGRRGGGILIQSEIIRT